MDYILRSSVRASALGVGSYGLEPMRLSKPISILVLLATLAPLAYFVFFFGMIGFFVLSAADRGPEPDLFKVIFILHMLCIVWIWGLMAFYLIYLFKSSSVPKDQKVLWAVVLFIANVMAMPVFWWLYVWPGSKRADVAPPSA